MREYLIVHKNEEEYKTEPMDLVIPLGERSPLMAEFEDAIVSWYHEYSGWDKNGVFWKVSTITR